VDADRAAIQWAERRLAGLTAGAIRFVNGLAEEAVRRLPEPEAVVANPPRQGLESSLTTRLDRWAARHRGRVVYVSCDPATLARDLGRMPAMRLIHVQAYDLFPQTSHVEVLAVLEAA
jgi:tRNA/tmRNA/rRNA uracil-C5-methylase (TrmA/RlmC/RlmD family)